MKLFLLFASLILLFHVVDAGPTCGDHITIPLRFKVLKTPVNIPLPYPNLDNIPFVPDDPTMSNNTKCYCDFAFNIYTGLPFAPACDCVVNEAMAMSKTWPLHQGGPDHSAYINNQAGSFILDIKDPWDNIHKGHARSNNDLVPLSQGIKKSGASVFFASHWTGHFPLPSAQHLLSSSTGVFSRSTTRCTIELHGGVNANAFPLVDFDCLYIYDCWKTDGSEFPKWLNDIVGAPCPP
jgi:hypothetical protein